MDMAATWTPARTGSLAPSLILLAAAVVAANVQSFFIPIDGDVSWLITVSEQVLAGKRLYIDLFEVNPPASVWLYVPMVWLAQLTGLRAEGVVAGTTILLAFLCSFATLRLASRLRHSPPPIAFAATLGFVTLVLPGGLFAQREHVALLLALPTLTVFALLAEQHPLSARTRFVAGLAAGLVVVIKPHFALAVGPAALWAAWQARSLRPLVPAIVAGALVLAAYAAGLLLFARAYFDYLPLLAGTYLHMRERWHLMLAGPSVFTPAALLGLAALLRPARVPPLATTLFLGTVGFALAAVIQGKSYANHALPGTALGIAAFGVLLLKGGVTRERQRLVGAAALIMAAIPLSSTHRILPQPGLAEALRRVAPPNPKMITLGTELVTGHPAVRNVDGRWIGSRASLFTVAGVQYRRPTKMSGAERVQLERWYQADIQSFADDVARGRPDVVLVEVLEKRWIAREPLLVKAMRPYRYATRAGDIEIWLRR
ncbi:hypothetical protein [Sphingomonas arenae]|uniref:hypothetical protein n=1 Tax=Sphingomonas arenae TaxID=2812555 RepID=UPI00196806E8|nr:hypothetical protein [Sphingomonas arenae]